MEVSRREEEAPREDTVPDVSSSRSVEAAGGVAEQATKPLVPGDVVAEKYVVERVLGMGGMAQVLAARHVKLGTKVAIKVVHPQLAVDPQAGARFLREAQAMAQLESEHTVRVHDVGELPGGVPYMIMEYLDGKDLGALLVERGPLPVPLALEYVRQACDALAEAHAAGIIHRDVKPQNLFVVRRSSGAELVRVLDFGLAKPVTASAKAHELTQAGHVIGTAHYMAPEQLRGGASVDTRADVWGLGATLFRLLTRQYPFQESNAALAVAAILARDPAPIKRLRPDVPDPVAALVDRCLSKDPTRRFQSVNELAFAIDQARATAMTSSQSFAVPATPSQSFVPVRPPAPAPPDARTPFAQPPPPPTTNAPRWVSLVLLAMFVVGGALGSIALMKRKSANIIAPATASTVVAK